MNEQFPDALAPGQHLQQYEIMSILGQGGFGITYLAKNVKLNQKVAIKEFLPADMAVRDTSDIVRPKTQLQNDNFTWGIDRFLKEAQTLARFKHPNMVRIYDYFEANGTAYMIMEYEEGRSFSSIIREKRTLLQKDILTILLPLLDGLEVLHQQNIIHRDIKPPNIYIRENGSPVLLDFGAARQALGGQTKTMTALLTPGYAPFEQYYADAKQQGPWTDLYALGAVVYHCIKGRKPVESSLRGATQMSGNPDPLIPMTEDERQHYSETFLNSVEKSLAVLKDDRWQSATEWKQALQADPCTKELLELNSTGRFDRLGSSVIDFNGVASHSHQQDSATQAVGDGVDVDNATTKAVGDSVDVDNAVTQSVTGVNAKPKSSPIVKSSADKVNRTRLIDSNQKSSCCDNADVNNIDYEIARHNRIPKIIMMLLGGLIILGLGKLAHDILGSKLWQKETDALIEVVPQPNQPHPSISFNPQSNVELKSAYPFSVKIIPSGTNAVIKILNIQPKYEEGMLLAPGDYHIKVTAKGYETYEAWVALKYAPLTHVVFLKKIE